MKEPEIPEDVAAERSEPGEPFAEPLAGDLAEAVEGRAGEHEGDTYVPPTDPVVTTDEHGNAQVLGGFSSTSADVTVAHSTTPGPGDEALADAVRRELRQDAATAGLQLQVEVRDRVAYLRGEVTDLADADEAEAVAGRVPGLDDVVDETEVAES
jgi:hypothetical protein